MKVIFEGTLKEIKEEIAIFLWEGSMWATKEELNERLQVKERLTDTEKFLDSWNSCRDGVRNLIENLYHYEYLPQKRVEDITSLKQYQLGGMISSGTKNARRNRLPKPIIKFIQGRADSELIFYKISSQWREFLKEHTSIGSNK